MTLGLQGEIKLWHDDVRPAPRGWEWARTNTSAERILSGQAGEYRVTEISLDHDLGGHDINMVPPEMGGDADAWFEKMYYRGGIACGEGCGCDLVKWMIKNDLVPSKVTIHSWNPARAKEMAALLNDAGFDAYIEPFDFARYLAR